MNEHTIADSLLSPSLPDSLRSMGIPELESLADDAREAIIGTVLRTGGHLASSLGAVDLTVALLHVFDPALDSVIWDVGHQSYAWKLLTGRAGRFGTLRQFGGLSGFTSRAESKYDKFGAGHASTSISAALGIAKARDLRKGRENVVAVIGDGSLTGGMAFEALNNAGAQGGRFIVVLNDNEMSISHNVGALSLFLSRNLSADGVMRIKKLVEKGLTSIPKIGDSVLSMAMRGENSFKAFFTPGMLFEAFGFNYIGPVDGHNMTQLIQHLELAKAQDRPVLLHVRTQKGHGYTPAEEDPAKFHGVRGFTPERDLVPPKPRSDEETGPGFSKTFGQTLCELADDDRRIVAITAAMPDGTGLAGFRERHPERFIDVGICEQHAVTMAAGLACEGCRPVVAVYSTFLQRAYDQIIHDVCLQKLSVVFCLDRAGLVGEDGATHHGAFDLSYLRTAPNLALAAPRDEADLRNLLYTALHMEGPVAIRYPSRPTKSNVVLEKQFTFLTPGKGEMLLESAAPADVKKQRGLCVIAAGHRAHPALRAVRSAAERLPGCAVSVFDPRWIKPLDEEAVLKIAGEYAAILLVEENTRIGGFSSAVLECLADHDALGLARIRRCALPDAFIGHGSIPDLRASLGIDAAGLDREIIQILNEMD